MAALNRPLFVKLGIGAFLLETALLIGLISVTPHAGPHHTGFWILVLAQFAGVMVAAGLVLPFKAQLGPFFFELTYYSVVFVVQLAMLEVLALLVVKILGSGRRRSNPATSAS